LRTYCPLPDNIFGNADALTGLSMKFLVLYAHPVADSFGAAVHRRVVDALTQNGHEIDDCDLYAENFCPAMSADERRNYHDSSANTSTVLTDIERLCRAEGVVFVFPTWWYGPPAILKGYIDRVWVPGVAFELRNGRTRPLLQHIRRFAVVTTYGSPWWLNKFVARDPNRHAFMHGIRYLVARRAATRWLALYGLDYASGAKRHRFLERVGVGLRGF
jgi:NAD(P)H dehydrogenase (quinone)